MMEMERKEKMLWLLALKARKVPCAMECRRLLEAGKCKETDSSLQPPEGTQSWGLTLVF